MLVLLCFVACSENVCLTNTIVKSDSDIIKVDMFENNTSISFYANNLWKISTESSWITLSKEKGNEGDNLVEINIKSKE